MSEKIITAARAAEPGDKVPVFIPKAGAGEDPTFYVSVSTPTGSTRAFTLPRGKTSYVPRAVYEEIKRADRAREALQRRKNKLLESAML